MITKIDYTYFKKKKGGSKSSSEIGPADKPESNCIVFGSRGLSFPSYDSYYNSEEYEVVKKADGFLEIYEKVRKQWET